MSGTFWGGILLRRSLHSEFRGSGSRHPHVSVRGRRASRWGGGGGFQGLGTRHLPSALSLKPQREESDSKDAILR